MRTYLAKEGHNHKDINKLKLFTCKKSPKVNTVIVSYRDPASRITSSFVNKFHIYENRTIFDGKKKVQTFSKEFSDKITPSLYRNHGTRREHGNFSIRDMILFLWECKRSGGLSEVNPHFTPQLLSKKQLHAITSCSSRGFRLFPLKVKSFQDDLNAINRVLDINYTNPHKNSTSLPDQDWTFSNSADLVDLPLSILYADKVIPKSGSLRNALHQDQDFNAKYMDVFGHDYELSRWMDGVRQTGKKPTHPLHASFLAKRQCMNHCPRGRPSCHPEQQQLESLPI